MGSPSLSENRRLHNLFYTLFDLRFPSWTSRRRGSGGYRRLSTVLFSDLMQLFEAYKKARPETSDQLAHDRPNQNR
jgi:hypothetical protein